MRIEAAKSLRIYGITLGLAGAVFLSSLWSAGLTPAEALYWMWIVCGLLIIAVGIRMWLIGRNRLVQIYEPLHRRERNYNLYLKTPESNLEKLLVNPNQTPETRDQIADLFITIWRYAATRKYADVALFREFASNPLLIEDVDGRERFAVAVVRFMEQEEEAISSMREKIKTAN